MEVKMEWSHEARRLYTVSFERKWDAEILSSVPIKVAYEVVRHDDPTKATNIPGFFGPKGCVREDTLEAVTLSAEEEAEVQKAVLAATQKDDDMDDDWDPYGGLGGVSIDVLARRK